MKQLVGALCLFYPILLIAQDRAAINGTVTDASGAVVGGAQIELTSPANGLHRKMETNERGLYEITPLPVGAYILTVSKTGFKPVSVKQIDLQFGETRTIDTRLEVGTTTDAVEVTATADTLNRTNAEVGAVIESAQIKEIPVSGRNGRV